MLMIETRPEDIELTATGPVDETELVHTHLWLADTVARSLLAGWPRHVDRSEMHAAARLGLVEAARRFDPAQGVTFERFARIRIHGAVLDAARAADWAPRALRAAARELEAATSELTAALGRTPTRSELCERIGIEFDELDRWRGEHHRAMVLSLDSPVDEDTNNMGAGCLGDMVVEASEGAEDRVENSETAQLVRIALELLPERERIVVVGYFLEGRTSEELARLFGVTVSRISQIRSEALTRIREAVEAQFHSEATTVKAPRGNKMASRLAAQAKAARVSWREPAAVCG